MTRAGWTRHGKGLFCTLDVPLHQFLFFPSGLPASLQDQCLAGRMAQGSCFKRLIMLLSAKSIEREPIIKGFFNLSAASVNININTWERKLFWELMLAKPGLIIK